MFSRIFIRLPLYREGAAQLKRHLLLLWSSFRGGTPRSTPGPGGVWAEIWVRERRKESPEKKKLLIDHSSYPSHP